ncbi:MAG: energy-coupling factor transporter transmembrane component T [Anaerolineales bacterium]
MLVTWRYRLRNGLMEKFDPRARWIFSLAFLFAVTIFWDARFLLFFFVLSLIWYFSGRVSWHDSRRGWYLITFMMFMMIAVNTIVTGGGAGGVVPPGGHLVWPQGTTIPLINWHFHFGLTYERLWFAICQFLRIGGISAIFLVIPYTMDPRVYGITFRGLGLPDRFAYSMELAFRYVPTLARDRGRRDQCHGSALLWDAPTHLAAKTYISLAGLCINRFCHYPFGRRHADFIYLPYG